MSQLPVAAAIIVVLMMQGVVIVASQKHFNSDVPCATDADCHISQPVAAFCEENTCVFSRNIGRQLERFTVVSRLGSACRFDEECLVEQAVCAQNRCTCGNSTAPSMRTPHKCIAASDFGGACEEDDQCRGSHTACILQRCACAAGFRRSQDGACEELRGLGSACAPTTLRCDLPFAECSAEGACACQQGYIAHDRQCLRANMTYLSSCDKSAECSRSLGEASTCFEGLCHCHGHASFDKLTNACLEDPLAAHEDPATSANGGAQWTIVAIHDVAGSTLLCALFARLLSSCLLHA